MIPEEVALLPPEEKAKLIVELRRQGKTYREIQSQVKVSPRDIKRALDAFGKAEGKPEAVDDELGLPTDQIKEAIRLMRSGKAKNPNDLVLQLGIPFSKAKALWERVMENENLTPVTIQKEKAELKNLLDEGWVLKQELSEAMEDAGDAVECLRGAKKLHESLRSLNLKEAEELSERFRGHIELLRGLKKEGVFDHIEDFAHNLLAFRRDLEARVKKLEAWTSTVHDLVEAHNALTDTVSGLAAKVKALDAFRVEAQKALKERPTTMVVEVPYRVVEKPDGSVEKIYDKPLRSYTIK